MKNVTAIVIIAVAVGLLAYILLVDQQTMTSSQLGERKDRVFVEFRRDAVNRIVLAVDAGEPVTLEKAPGGSAGDDDWMITKPQSLAADSSAVREVLSAVDFVLKDRVIKDGGTAKEPRYGFDKPQVSASLVIGNTTVSIQIGATDPSGKKVYVAVDGRDEFYAVDTEFRDTLRKDMDDLRDKHLIPGAASPATSIAITGPGGSGLRAKRTDPGSPWHMDLEAGSILASQEAMADLLRDLVGLRAQGFEHDAKADTGLDKPSYRIALTDAQEGATTILLGKQCPGQEAQIYGTLEGSDLISCVRDDILTQLALPVARYRELRAAVFEAGDVEKISLASGERSLVLEKAEEGWGAVGTDEEIDPEAVAELLNAVSQSKAVEIRVGSASVAEMGNPAVQLTLHLDGGQGKLALSIFEGPLEGRYTVKREQEEALLAFEGNLHRTATPDVLGFRNRRMVLGPEENITAISVRQGSFSQTVKREGENWTLTQPIRVAADNDGAARLAKQMGTLAVDRFVAPGPLPEHGLDTPFAVVEAQWESPTEEVPAGGVGKTVTLVIGAPAPGAGRFAMRKGKDVVFVLNDEFTSSLNAPLVARDLVGLETSDGATVTITRGSETLTLTRADAGGWTNQGKPVDVAAVNRLLADLDALKAVRVDAFTVPAKKFPTAIAVRVDGAGQSDGRPVEPRELFLGPRSDREQDDGFLAVQPGLDVAFVVPARLVTDLEALLKAP